MQLSTRLKGDGELFWEAIKKYTEAARIKPDDHAAYYNWGNALADLARLKGEEELFWEAFKKYAEAVRINPDYHEAYNNWGNTLADLAKLKGEKEHFQEAFKKYAEALRIKPDKHEVYKNWGIGLMNLASLTGDNNFLEEASEKLLKAEEIMEGLGAFNLACIASLRKESEKCRSWLAKAQETGHLPSLKEINEESDFNNVRNENWFKEFLSKLEEE